jgi:LysR family transcriptional regulator, low CO2-responsive transcriptional regulator
MNLRHLAVFRAVAQTGTVNAAAALAHTSQPAVSREVRNLEERLGVVLFDRLPRGMRLTEAGQMLFGYAEKIFALEKAAERAMRELADLEGGQLAIGASNTLGMYLLPALVSDFYIRHPKVQLSLEIRNTEEVVVGVLDSRFGIGFVEGPVLDEAIEAKEFRRDRIVAVVAPNHPLAKMRQTTARALAEAPAILREPGSGTREIVESAFAKHRLALQRVLQISSAEALKRVAMAGGGVGWVSELCVAEELHSGRLVELATARLPLTRPLYALRLRGRQLSNSAREFMQGFES